MFIKLDNNNKIVESATFKVNNDFIETNKKIVRNCTGELVFEEDLDQNQESNNLLQNEIYKLKEQITNEIFNNYPITKQIDIMCRFGEYTDEDFDNMKNFINQKIAEYKIVKNNL